MRSQILLLILTIGLAACAGETVEEPKSTAEIAGIVEDWAQRTPVPGVVVAMHGDGLCEFQFAYGTLTRDGTAPVEVSSPFRVASITKTLVAVVIVQLVEEGRISLGDEVLTRLADDVSGGELLTLLEGVTVGDLLAHTSGLPDSARSVELVDALRVDPERRWKTEEVLGLIADRDREFEPGEDFGYSNTNYLVLGMVIEEVTGAQWWHEVRDRVLDPVRMTDSYIAGYEEPIGELTSGYFDLDNDGFTEEVPRPWPALETSEGASGALVSTAPDLIRFMTALAGDDLISEPSRHMMTTAGLFSSRFTGYGLGLEILKPDLETVVWGHGGFVPGHRSVLWHVADNGPTIVVLTNESRSRPDALTELLLGTVARQGCD